MSKPVDKKRLLSPDDGRAQLKFVRKNGKLNLEAKIRYMAGNDFLGDNVPQEAAAIKAALVDVVDSYVGMHAKKSITASQHRIEEFKKWFAWKFQDPDVAELARPIIKEWLGIDV